MLKKKFPTWLDNAVFYEIYPQSFKDTNGDGIGDLDGIIEKLDYIKELGCTAIWINPCFDSPFGDAGYDVSDYYKIAPRYGTNEDMRKLLNEAHKRNMHILLDLVPGHTSIEHKWFKESVKAEKNEYTDRYIWTDTVWNKPKGYSCLRGISDRDGSVAVNFFSHQPALNYGYYKKDPDEPWRQSIEDEGPQNTIKAMMDVMRFWLTMGCDGFRVDMASSLVKDDEDSIGTTKIWKKIRKFLDEEFPEAVLIAEWGEPSKSIPAGFHMDFLLQFNSSHYNDLFRCEKPFFAGNGDVYEFVSKYKENYEKTYKKGLMCIPSGNHDIERLSKTIKGKKLHIAYGFILSMPGAPYIYYGDEIGMRYIEGLKSVEGGFKRTGTRSPMQWDNSLNAGFSTANKELLYVPVDENENRPNVKEQIADESSLLNEIKRLIAFRKEHTCLQSKGDIEFVYAKKNEYPLAYIRKDENEKLFVIVNPSDREIELSLDLQIKEKLYLIGTSSIDKNKIKIGKESYVVYELKSK